MSLATLSCFLKGRILEFFLRREKEKEWPCRHRGHSPPSPSHTLGTESLRILAIHPSVTWIFSYWQLYEEKQQCWEDPVLIT